MGRRGRAPPLWNSKEGLQTGPSKNLRACGARGSRCAPPLPQILDPPLPKVPPLVRQWVPLPRWSANGCPSPVGPPMGAPPPLARQCSLLCCGRESLYFRAHAGASLFSHSPWVGGTTVFLSDVKNKATPTSVYKSGVAVHALIHFT